jgi:hypothetical protein
LSRFWYCTRSRVLPDWVLPDDRAGHEALLIKDKRSGDQLEFDGAAMGITIKATSALTVKADGLVSIEGTSVQLNGCLVLAGTKPI